MGEVVASVVGLRTPSLYNHFPSKGSLYAAVLDRGIGPVLSLLSDFVDSKGEADSSEVMERVMQLLEQRPSLPRSRFRPRCVSAKRSRRNWFPWTTRNTA